MLPDIGKRAGEAAIGQEAYQHDRAAGARKSHQQLDGTYIDQMREDDGRDANEHEHRQPRGFCGIDTRPVGELEDLLRPIDTRHEPDETPGKFVEQHPAGVEPREIQSQREEENECRPRVTQKPHRNEEHRKRIDEPEHGKRLDRDHQQVDIGDVPGAAVGDHLDTDLDDRPENVEIGKVNDFSVDEFPQVAIKRLVGEEAGDEKEKRHTEGFGEFRDGAENGGHLANGVRNTEGRVFHHHQNDRQAFYGVDPVDALFRYNRCARAGHFGAPEAQKCAVSFSSET